MANHDQIVNDKIDIGYALLLRALKKYSATEPSSSLSEINIINKSIMNALSQIEKTDPTGNIYGIALQGVILAILNAVKNQGSVIIPGLQVYNLLYDLSCKFDNKNAINDFNTSDLLKIVQKTTTNPKVYSRAGISSLYEDEADNQCGIDLHIIKGFEHVLFGNLNYSSDDINATFIALEPHGLIAHDLDPAIKNEKDLFSSMMKESNIMDNEVANIQEVIITEKQLKKSATFFDLQKAIQEKMSGNFALLKDEISNSEIPINDKFLEYLNTRLLHFHESNTKDVSSIAATYLDIYNDKNLEEIDKLSATLNKLIQSNAKLEKKASKNYGLQEAAQLRSGVKSLTQKLSSENKKKNALIEELDALRRENKQLKDALTANSGSSDSVGTPSKKSDELSESFSSKSKKSSHIEPSSIEPSSRELSDFDDEPKINPIKFSSQSQSESRTETPSSSPPKSPRR